MYTGVQYNSSKKGNSTCSLWQRKEENAAINWQGRSFWLAVSFKPSSSIRMYVRTYVHSVRIKDAWRLRNTTLHSCVAHHQFLFATLHRGTLSCQFVPGAVGWKHGGPRRGWSGGGGKKKRRYAWYDTAGGEQSRGGGVHLPLCFTFYCLPWIRPICIKRRTPPCRSVIHSLPGKSRDQTHTHTHIQTHSRHRVERRLATPFNSERFARSSLPLFCRRRRRGSREIFASQGASEVGRESRERVCRWYRGQSSANLSGTRTMRNLNVTWRPIKRKGEARGWVGSWKRGSNSWRKAISFLASFGDWNLINRRTQPGRFSLGIERTSKLQGRLSLSLSLSLFYSPILGSFSTDVNRSQ